MTTDKITELSMKWAVLYYIVKELMVVHCEMAEEPVAFAKKLLAQTEEAFADAPHDKQWQTEIQEEMKAFFGLIVSTLISKTSHHDA